MIDELRRRWREIVELHHPWRWDSKREAAQQGILNGMWVAPDATEAPYGAYLKPTSRCPYPAAGREKIAADLAFDLGVPAAPVVLTNAPAEFCSEQLEACVSLVTHPQAPPCVLAFEPALPQTPIIVAMRAAAPEPLSRIHVFDLWIGNVDRDNVGNILYGDDDQAPERNAFCAIDHSASMGGSGRVSTWRDGGWKDMQRLPFPASMSEFLDKKVMLRLVSDIQSLTVTQIRSCVERIPDRYMDGRIRNETVNGLVERKDLLRELVLQYP